MIQPAVPDPLPGVSTPQTGDGLEVLEALLQAAHRHPQLASWPQLRASHADAIDDLRDRAAHGAPELLTLQGTGPLIHAHLAAAAAQLPNLPDLARIAAAARAFDDLWGDLLVAAWTARLEERAGRLAPGDLVVLGGTDHLRALHGDRSIGAPQTRAAERADQTRSALLYRPQPHVPPIRFDRTLESQLALAVHGARSVATVHPDGHQRDLDLRFPVRPHDGTTHEARSVGLTAAALDGGAAIVALPEFTGYAEVTDRLRRLAPERSALIVAGSSHEGTRPHRSNRSLLWVARPDGPFPRARPLTATKRVPYEGALGTEPLDEVGTRSPSTSPAPGAWSWGSAATCSTMPWSPH